MQSGKSSGWAPSPAWNQVCRQLPLDTRTPVPGWAPRPTCSHGPGAGIIRHCGLEVVSEPLHLRQEQLQLGLTQQLSQAVAESVEHWDVLQGP